MPRTTKERYSCTRHGRLASLSQGVKGMAAETEIWCKKRPPPNTIQTRNHGQSQATKAESRRPRRVSDGISAIRRPPTLPSPCLLQVNYQGENHITWRARWEGRHGVLWRSWISSFSLHLGYKMFGFGEIQSCWGSRWISSAWMNSQKDGWDISDNSWFVQRFSQGLELHDTVLLCSS